MFPWRQSRYRRRQAITSSYFSCASRYRLRALEFDSRRYVLIYRHLYIMLRRRDASVPGPHTALRMVVACATSLCVTSLSFATYPCFFRVQLSPVFVWYFTQIGVHNARPIIPISNYFFLRMDAKFHLQNFVHPNEAKVSLSYRE